MKKEERTKAKESLIYFIQWILKNAQEGSMTEELIGFISHYLSF